MGISIKRTLAIALAAPALAFAQTKGLQPQNFRTEIKTVDGELWASGYDFKASFHDGFRYYARDGGRGVASFGWHTTAFGLEGRETSVSPEAPLTLKADGFRARYDFGGFVEIYDVRADGVEQSFVIRQKPVGEGALVVRGRVASTLAAVDRATDREAIVFEDASGTPRIIYGRAYVVDVDGSRSEIGTRVIGNSIELRVPEAIWKQARFPLTIDPLVRNGSLANPEVGSRLDDVHIVQTDSGPSSDLLVAVTIASGGDSDVYVFRCEAGLRNPRVVWSEVRWNVSVRCRDACYVAGADTSLFRLDAEGRYTWSWNRDWILRVTGSAYSVGLTSVTLTNPGAFGGTRPGTNGTHAIIVGWSWRRLGTTQSRYDIYAWLIDARTGRESAPILVATRTATNTRGLQGPIVSRAKDGRSDPWIVAWSDRDRSVMRMRRIWDDGRLDARAHDLAEASSAKIDGGSGRYLVVRNVANVTGPGRHVEAVRIDWTTSSTPRVGATRVLQHSQTGITSGRPMSLVFDTNTRSHWALLNSRPAFYGYDVDAIQFMRLGWDGSIVENHEYRETIADPNHGPIHRTSNITLDRRRDRFVYLRGTPDSSSIGAFELAHVGWARTWNYGTACSAARIYASGRPFAGTQSFSVQIRYAPPRRLAYLHLSTRSASLPGTGPGCTILVDPTAPGASVLPVTTNVFGSASYGLALPSDISLWGVFLYTQWVYYDTYPLTFGGITRYYDVERRSDGLLMRVGP